jgi:rhodanese-related sulfurtransferase
MNRVVTRSVQLFCIAVLVVQVGVSASVTAPLEARAATTGGADEVSTAELEEIIARRLAIVFDTRPYMEFAISHIPSALNVAPKKGVPMSVYVSDVAEIDRVLGGDRNAPVVLYCNGPFCGKSGRLAAELRDAGYTDVRRYQLGIPVWRALGGVTQIEEAGVAHVLSKDRTAVLIDGRDAAAHRVRTLRGARSIPQSRLSPARDSGEIREAKDDGRLPMEDHNTRIVVFGANGTQARQVAESIAREAFHNVAFFDGTYEDLAAALAKKRRR